MLKKTLIFLGILLCLGLFAFLLFRSYTKSFSPQTEEILEKGDLKISIQYSRPFKKGRQIFGELVPYNKPWRTGANESTTFTSNKNLIIKGKELPAGSYSLWSVPGEESWKIIWNSETGQWGINIDGEANFDPDKNVLEISAPVIETVMTFEQFTIDLDKVSSDIHMVFMWDKTMIVVPVNVKN